jgi:hypothetical protein
MSRYIEKFDVPKIVGIYNLEWMEGVKSKAVVLCCVDTTLMKALLISAYAHAHGL